MKNLEHELKAALEKADRAGEAVHRFAESMSDSPLVDVVFDVIDSPLGPLLAAMTHKGLVALRYTLGDTDAAIDAISERVSPRMIEAPQKLDAVARQLDEFFAGTRTKFDLPLDWSLTAGFTRKVLKATARIPFGRTMTYSQIAGVAGSPRGMRAAGNALGSNPIPIIVPCHRVLRSDGTIGGYTGGPEKKVLLLKLEGHKQAVAR